MTLSKMTLIALILEACEFGDLEDTRENIEAPEGLSSEGQFIVQDLHKNGITTTAQVDEFYDKYLKPLIHIII